MKKEHIVPGRFTPDVLDSLLAEAFAILMWSATALLNTFLGLKYQESTQSATNTT
jgi:hypothetical protein